MNAIVLKRRQMQLQQRSYRRAEISFSLLQKRYAPTFSSHFSCYPEKGHAHHCDSGSDGQGSDKVEDQANYTLLPKAKMTISDLLLIQLKFESPLPHKPKTTWKIEATMMAPWTSRILVCHNSVLSSQVMLAITSGAGHCHSCRLRIAKVGTRNVEVPPCIIGNLLKRRNCKEKNKWELDANLVPT